MSRWSPWAAVSNMPNVAVRHVPLPEETGGAVLQHRGDRIWILLDRDLGTPERRSALAHELVHLERGTSWRCLPGHGPYNDLVVREERCVDREVARRLVPVDELVGFVSRTVEVGHAVGPAAVAEEFNVSLRIARVALEELQARAA